MNLNAIVSHSRLALAGALIALVALPVAARQTPAKPTATKQAAAKPAKNLLVETDPINVDGTVNIVIVVPAGKGAKFEVEGKARLAAEARKPAAGQVPTFSYAAVPHTTLAKDKGGDGKAADAIVLGATASAGAVVKGRVLGILVFAGAAEGDRKLIVAAEGSPFYGCRNIADLDAKFPGEAAKAQTFFTSYKGKAAITAAAPEDRPAAIKFLGDAILDFEKTFYTEADKRPLDKDGNPSLYPWPGAKNLGE
ncbi:MAG TPA: inorganic diphosphatase [Holophaga sp.]|nr:inorganic diphosphatase [Holophaga sp.]